jgi:toxin-antitoxin system PIN domain toxin
MPVTGPARASPPVHLLDGNVLVALVSPSHVHHASAERWFAASSAPFATCPITQGTLVRLLMHVGQLPADAALHVSQQVVAHPRHRFWPDAIGYPDVAWRGVVGHRQVTDAYLAALARHFQGRLATFDRGLGSLHADVAVTLAAD